MFTHGFSVAHRCTSCSLAFEPEQGYYVGAIYVNYAAIVLIATPGFLLLDCWTNLTLTEQMII